MGANGRDEGPPDGVGLGRSYTLGPLLAAQINAAYQRKYADPPVRPLRIFAADPAMSRLQGNIVQADVPYEPLEPGPVGRLFEVRSEDADAGTTWQPANLEDHAVLLRGGYDPSEANPRFHQQMVYAVCSSVHQSFRRALGRELGWGGKAGATGRLAIYPFGVSEDNAYYDAEEGALRFGYFQAQQPVGRTLKDGWVFTSLSHDVIAHELTHALLDGLRAQFLTPSGPDVAAFHEGFADVVALLHHFVYPEALRKCIEAGRGDLRSRKSAYLYEIAQQFGRTEGEDRALRCATSPVRYDRAMECHDLGEVLLACVYDAFCTVYRRKTNRHMRLATGGTGILPRGELHPMLVEVLASEAAQLATQFLAIVIRAIDYCPPVDVHFGEFLQAIVTADCEMVLADPWGYREAFIDAFRERGVGLRNVPSLAEESLLWRPPRKAIPRIEALSFAQLKFDGDPGRVPTPQERTRQACALGDVATDPHYMAEFGLVAPGDKRLRDARVDLPCIESVRTVRRAGPDGRVVFDLVAEITQRCTVPRKTGQRGFSYWGGATVIVDPDGEVRYSILKSVAGEGRRERRLAFLEDARAARFWKVESNAYVLRGAVARLLHVAKRGKGGRTV